MRRWHFARPWLLALAVAAGVTSLAAPSPAQARWHHGWGWRPGWGNYRLGCCWGPRFAIGVAPPIFVRPPVIVGPSPPFPAARFWIAPHWRGPYWIPGHWA